jgi:hypothetical protein
VPGDLHQRLPFQRAIAPDQRLTYYVAHTTGST